MPDRVKIVGCYDVVKSSAMRLAKSAGCSEYKSLSEVFADEELDFVVVATQHKDLAEIASSALNSKLHVFVEKPGAIQSADLRDVANIAKQEGLKVHIGFNHIFHPAVLKLFELVQERAIGTLMYVRGRYGHGGRIGYENEWRAKKEISGGGELIDQGSHLLDISLRLLGNLSLDYAFTPTYFWNMSVEDNAFMALKNQDGRMAFLHASCTEWKNLFSLEVYGTTGKLEISGLGRSYGVETLIHFQMLPEMGPPQIKTWQFDGPDTSWAREMEQFTSDIENRWNNSDNSETSIRVLELIEDIYKRTGR